MLVVLRNIDVSHSASSLFVFVSFGLSYTMRFVVVSSTQKTQTSFLCATLGVCYLLSSTLCVPSCNTKHFLFDCALFALFRGFIVRLPFLLEMVMDNDKYITSI